MSGTLAMGSNPITGVGSITSTGTISNTGAVNTTLSLYGRSSPAVLSSWTNSGFITIANTTTPTSIFGTGVGNRTFPASTTTTGMTIKIRAIFTIGGFSGGGTLVFTFLSPDGSTMFTITSIALATGTGFLDYDVRNAGGNVSSGGAVLLLNANLPQMGAGTGLWNQSLANLWDVTATWSVASASNSITIKNVDMIVANQI